MVEGDNKQHEPAAQAMNSFKNLIEPSLEPSINPLVIVVTPAVFPMAWHILQLMAIKVAV